jgi:hypothetical protein
VSTAEQILDAIAWKHSKCALLREVVVEDAERRAAQQALYKHQHPGFGAKYYPDAEDYIEDKHGRILDTHRPFRRIDGLMLDGGGTRTAIEVKVSRSDFLRETEAKRRPWQKIVNRFVYATPPGLLRPEEIPTECGLWEVDDSGAVTIVRRAKANKNPDPIPHQVLVALAYRLKNAERSAA